MSKESDALNAFRGIEQRLEEYYPKGFFKGLPVEDFPWGLLWWAQRPPIRRLGYPTWSWLGWKVAVWHSEPRDVTKTLQFGVDVRIWKLSTTGPELLFKMSYQSISPLIKDDALQYVKSEEEDKSSALAGHINYTEAEENNYILLDAVSFDLVPDFSRPWGRTPRDGEHMRYDLEICGVGCFLYLIGTDPEIRRMSKDEKRIYLLLARDRMGGWVSHYLLVVNVHGAVAVRGTVMMLFVPEKRLDVLASLKPRMSSVSLS